MTNEKCFLSTAHTEWSKNSFVEYAKGNKQKPQNLKEVVMQGNFVKLEPMQLERIQGDSGRRFEDELLLRPLEKSTWANSVKGTVLNAKKNAAQTLPHEP